MFKDHCYKCHSGPKAQRKLRYDDPRYLKKLIGTEDHQVIVPGRPEESLLFRLASLPRSDSDAMPPPRRGDPLNSAQLALLKRWIIEGAKLESTTSASPKRDGINEWVNKRGKTLRAAFVEIDGSNVKLRKEDGVEISYPIANLSRESQELAKKFAQ